MARKAVKATAVAAAPPPASGGIVDVERLPDPVTGLPMPANAEPDFIPPTYDDETALDVSPTYPPERAAKLEARCDAVNSRNVQNVDGDFSEDEFDDLQDMRIAAKRDLLEATNSGNHQARMEALLKYVGVTMVDCGSARDLGCFVTNYARISRDLAAIDKTKERRQNIAQARNRKRKHNKTSIVEEK